MALNLPQGVQITGPIKPGYESILTHDALANWLPSCTVPSKPAARNC